MNSPPKSCPSPGSSDSGTWYLRNIPCPRPGCGRMYSSNSSLRNHLRRKHKGIMDMESPAPPLALQVSSPQERIGAFPLPSVQTPDARMFPQIHRQITPDLRQQPAMPLKSSASAGDVRYVQHLRGSASSGGGGPTTPRGRSIERVPYTKGKQEFTRSMSDPGRRWPKDAYDEVLGSTDGGDDNDRMNDVEALHRGAAAIAAMFPPSHHVHHQQWSLNTPPTTMRGVESVPEEPFANEVHEEEEEEQWMPPPRMRGFQPLHLGKPSSPAIREMRDPRGLPSNHSRASSHGGDDVASRYNFQSAMGNGQSPAYFGGGSGSYTNSPYMNQPPPQRPVLSYPPPGHSYPQLGQSPYSQPGQSNAQPRPMYSHQPPQLSGPPSGEPAAGTPESVASLDETLKKTHLSSSAKKFSIQHLLGISA